VSGRYLVELADWLRQAGVRVVEYDGWQTRARSSGGYADGRPWGVMWHHTASSTSPENDASYMCHGSDSRPVANLLVARDGVVWVLAAGATNTNGKGGPWTWSRGTVPLDSMNTYAVGVEIANNGVGEPFPAVQVDAAFAVSTTLAARLGLPASDVCTHQRYAPDRKIDPSTAAAVQGSWRPRSSTSSGTWNLDDLIAECSRRAGAGPTPIPPPGGDDDVEKYLVRDTDGYPWVTDFASYATSITEEQAEDGVRMRGYVKGADNHPFPLSPSDSDLMRRLAAK
jgi:hypothetical protein